MDIIRRTNNDKFIYFDKKTRRRILDENTIKRINSLRIPPAYTNVKISKRANNKVQAIGTDTKKRKQYIYNKEYVEMQKEIKFEDLMHFGRKIKRIRKDINNNIKMCSKDGSKIRDRLINKFYRPHHKKFYSLVKSKLDDKKLFKLKPIVFKIVI